MVAYPFVAAEHYTSGGLIDARALVIHMAEGGGTVSWLTHPSGDNSADFVIAYSGAVTQMVRDADYSHSLHWDLAHLSAPDCGVFDPATAIRLLGIPTTTSPLPYIKAVEIEGFAATGPNAAQVAALEGLIAECRRRWPKMRGLLGHRDFMGYKACPGCHVFDKVAHGAFAPPEDPMRSFTFDKTARAGTLTIKGPGHSYLRLRDNKLVPITDPAAFGARQAFGPVKLVGGGITGPADTRVDGYVVGFEAAFLILADVTFTAEAGDCAPAVADERLRWATWLQNAPS